MKEMKNPLQSLDRSQGCFVGAIDGVGSASVLLKRPEMDDFREFWLKTMDSIRVFGRFCANLADSERVSKYEVMAVGPVGALMLYAHLEWPEMIDSGAFWAKVGDFSTF
jgi:hypothetical protein